MKEELEYLRTALWVAHMSLKTGGAEFRGNNGEFVFWLGMAKDFRPRIQAAAVEAARLGESPRPLTNLLHQPAECDLDDAIKLVNVLIAQSSVPTEAAAKATNNDATLDERAAAAKVANPEFSDQQVADAIGCHVKTLFKPNMVKYKISKKALKSIRAEKFGKPSDRRRR